MPGILEKNPTYYPGRWPEVFGREAPLYVEIGAGKGDFIIATAKKYPHIDFVGIEKSPTVLYLAAKKNQENPLPNLRFLQIDAGFMTQYFSSGQIERIYLNFSDPWPKTRHESRRLTAKEKLFVYERLLKPGGQIHLKTDQENFFLFSLKTLIQSGWSVGKITRDLYRSGFEGNIATEYEQRFLFMGKPIYRMESWSPAAHKSSGAMQLFRMDTACLNDSPDQ